MNPEETKITKDTKIEILEHYDGVSVQIGDMYWWRNQEDGYEFLQEIFQKLGFTNVTIGEAY